MKAISLWQPWAWAILALGKDVENRVWQTHYRGPLLLHAAQRRPTEDEVEGFLEFAEEAIGPVLLRDHFKTLVTDQAYTPLAVMRALPRGGIVGRVEVVDCVKGHKSPWAMHGQFQWVLSENRITLPFKPYKGSRGFFEVDYEGLKDAPPAPPSNGQMELI